MTSSRYMTSAQGAKRTITIRQNGLTSRITVTRADRLTRALRAGVAELQAEQSGTSQPRTYGYGYVRVDTEKVFREIDSKGALHLINTITADEIDGISAYVVFGSPSGSQGVVFPGDFPGNQGLIKNGIPQPEGTITSGRFSGTGVDGKGDPIGAKIIPRLGAPGQTFIQPFVDETDADSTFVGTGIAYTYSKWIFIQGRFEGDPEVTVLARLRKAVDPRTSTAGWSFNPYVQLYDLLTKDKAIGGAEIDPASIDSTTFSAGANWADMELDVPNVTRTALVTTDTNKSFANHLFEFNQGVTPFTYGDVVEVVASAGQSMPPNFSPGTRYHVIPIRHRINNFQFPAIALAASLNDALDGTYILQGTRTTDIDVRKVAEIRHMSGFTYKSNEVLSSVVQKILESCSASLYISDGKIAITQTSFPVSTETVTEDDILGAISLNNRLPSSERVTALTGIYNSALNLFTPKDYPTVDGGGIYQVLDNGKAAPGRFDLPFTGKAGVAQRQALIRLRRSRQERTVSFSGDLSLYRLSPGTIFTLDKPSLGLDVNTTFEVRDHTLFVEIADDVPTIGIDVTGRQLESSTFDLSASDEQLVEETRIPGIESPFNVGTPGNPLVTESLFSTSEGAGVRTRATITWTPSEGGFVESYVVSYKEDTDVNFTFLPKTPDLEVVINDLAPGIYTFRVVALNTLGLESDFATTSNIEILGLSAPPSDPTGFNGQITLSAGIILQWDRSVDLDVRQGGVVEIRHQSDDAGGKSGDSRDLAIISGDAAVVQVPFVLGTYYIRFIDQTGNSSGFAEWSTDGVRPVPFGQTITGGVFDANNSTLDQITIQEDPTFPSTNPSNTLVEDDLNDWLTLPLEGGIDSITDIDTVTDIDAIPASNSVAPEGLYFFATNIDLSARARVLLESVVTTEVVDVATGIDSIDNIDLIPNIDAIGAGTAQVGQATAFVEARYSPDAAAADTFGPWERLESRIFNHRSWEFRLKAKSLVPTVNIRITELRIVARELPVDV